MKYILLIVIVICTKVFAINFSNIEKSYWLKKISTSCQNSFISNHGQKKINVSTGTCECVAENFLILSERESNIKNAIDQLNWIDLYYSKRLSEEEIEIDPFFLDHYLFVIGDGCMKYPNFRP